MVVLDQEEWGDELSLGGEGSGETPSADEPKERETMSLEIDACYWAPSRFGKRAVVKFTYGGETYRASSTASCADCTIGDGIPTMTVHWELIREDGRRTNLCASSSSPGLLGYSEGMEITKAFQKFAESDTTKETPKEGESKKMNDKTESLKDAARIFETPLNEVSQWVGPITLVMMLVMAFTTLLGYHMYTCHVENMNCVKAGGSSGPRTGECVMPSKGGNEDD